MFQNDVTGTEKVQEQKMKGDRDSYTTMFQKVRTMIENVQV